MEQILNDKKRLATTKKKHETHLFAKFPLKSVSLFVLLLKSFDEKNMKF